MMKRVYAAIVKRCLMLFIASDGSPSRVFPDMISLLISEISDAPIIVSCEKNAIPIISVTIAWKINSIFPHLIVFGS